MDRRPNAIWFQSSQSCQKRKRKTELTPKTGRCRLVITPFHTLHIQFHSLFSDSRDVRETLLDDFHLRQLFVSFLIAIVAAALASSVLSDNRYPPWTVARFEGEYGDTADGCIVCLAAYLPSATALRAAVERRNGRREGGKDVLLKEGDEHKARHCPICC